MEVVLNLYLQNEDVLRLDEVARQHSVGKPSRSQAIRWLLDHQQKPRLRKPRTQPQEARS